MHILVGIPAFNEETTIESVIHLTQLAVPTCDIVVVNDGSNDRSGEIVRNSGTRLLNLPCNLGYSNAIETLLQYAQLHDYDLLILIDADGQHDPQILPAVLNAFQQCQCNMLIGSRYLSSGNYIDSPLGRRLGMILFSHLTKILTGKRIFDTTSGMKVLDRTAMKALIGWQFLDFHAEAIIYLLWINLIVEEYPIIVKAREHGESMYSFFSHILYPLTVLLMILITLIHLEISRRRRKLTI